MTLLGGVAPAKQPRKVCAAKAIEEIRNPRIFSEALRETLKEAAQEEAQSFYCNQNDAGWLAFYSAFKEFGVEVCNKLNGLFDLARACGWVLMYDETAIVVERPTEIHMDDMNPPRLHCADGPALVHSSGWGIYAWHGVRTTEKAIMYPSTLTVADVKEQENAESRRVIVERMGYEKYFNETRAKVIDRDFVDVQVGAGKPMPRVLFQDMFGDRYLLGTDGSTERCYAMPVPNTVNTCRTAHEAICGLDEANCLAQG
jgi:hypothetical protein